MRQTNSNSIEVFQKKEKPTLAPRHAEIMAVLKRYDRLTSFEVLTQININREHNNEDKTSLNKISGRFSELRDKGLITEEGKRLINGSPFTIYQIVKPKVEANPGTQASITF